MRILVTGAAGYVGSIVTEHLVQQGHHVTALDSLRHGHRAAVHPAAVFVQGDLLDEAWLQSLVQGASLDAVVHLAAEALIDESIRDPGRFYRANVCGGLNLIDAMVAAKVDRLVFSSTAAVYGEPATMPITEDSGFAPVNSYGDSKLAFERALAWYKNAHGLKYVSLRYFNAAGATEAYGEYHVPETHLIPIVFEAALGQRPEIRLFGTDYDTPDGTCIRDYIHVWDIANAHVLALEKIDQVAGRAYNMGNAAGYSNLKVIDMVRQVTGRQVKVVPSARRPGDPPRLVASAQCIQQDLGWRPSFPKLQTIVETAWNWRLKHPTGYPA
jgi:UDP-glucose 4-epimerase